jgi:stress response protein YsnF
MEVGKRDVETGGVRVRSRIVERPVEENIRLRKVRVYVIRKPGDRDITPGKAANFKDKTIEVKEHAEKAVVEKTAQVTEEISVNKDVDMVDETIRNTIRGTEVDIDDYTTKTVMNRDKNLNMGKERNANS